MSFKEQLLKAIECKNIPCTVAGFTECFLKNWNAVQRNEYQSYGVAAWEACDGDKAKAMRHNLDCRAVQLGVCDADGNLIFSEADLPSLMDKNGAVINRLSSAILNFNGLGLDDKDEQEKNSK